VNAAAARPRLALLSLIVLAASAVAAAVVYMYMRSEPDPARSVRRAWARHGVDKPNVVLITLDTTRADHLGSYGYAEARTPATDALARTGARFTQAATPVPLTLPAHASMMTGLYPTYHGVRLNGTTALSQDRTTMAEVFTHAGYQTGAFIAAFVLDSRWGLNQGFGVYDDQFDLHKFRHLDLAGVQRRGDEVMDRALDWLDGHKQGPFFAWVHLYDAHSPYEPPEPLLSDFRNRGLAGLYDGEIAFADQQVARCISWLQRSGLDQRTIVVVAGDHGEALGSHGEGTHGYFVYDYALHVPLIISTPIDDLRGVRVDEQVSLVDVFPTVLALAGIDVPGRVHGRSLVPLMYGVPPEHPLYAYGESMTPSVQYGWSPLHCLRSPRYKFVQAPRPELYDLVADSGESHNIVREQQDVARLMSDELKRVMDDTSRDAPAPEAANLDRETLQRLASLGYVGGSPASKSAATSGILADPKDRLAAFVEVQRAGELMGRDEYGPAVEALEAALKEDPSMPQARVMLGSCYSEMGRTSDARNQFDGVLKDDPQSIAALIGLANVLLAQGQTSDVITLCNRTLSLDDRNTQAYTLLGDVYIGRHEPAKALPYLEKAVQIQPKLTQNQVNLAACLIDVKNFSRAQQLLEAVLSGHPKFPGAQFNLGVLFEELGRPQEARTAYEAEVANYPTSFKARFNLGKILAQLEDWPGSIAQMREVVRIAPRRAEGHLFLARGLLHETAAPLDETERLVQQGLRLADTADLKALGWFLMADIFNRRHQPEQMNAALKNARRQAAAVKGAPRETSQRN
jgi:arylsulfatase A-like enzyme/tetratricopeptide (TPR) repeat protein